MAYSIALGGVTLLPRASSPSKALGVVYDPYGLIKPRLDAAPPRSFDASAGFGRPVISPMCGIVFHVVCIDNKSNSVIPQTVATRSAIYPSIRSLIPGIRVAICNDDGAPVFCEFAKPDTVMMTASNEVSELRGMADFVFFDVKFHITLDWKSDVNETFRNYGKARKAHMQYTLVCDFPGISLSFGNDMVPLRTLTCPVTFEYRCRHITTHWFTGEGIMKPRKTRGFATPAVLRLRPKKQKKRTRESGEDSSASESPLVLAAPHLPSASSPVGFEPTAALRAQSEPFRTETVDFQDLGFLGNAYRRARTAARPYPLERPEPRRAPMSHVEQAKEIARSAARAAARAAAEAALQAQLETDRQLDAALEENEEGLDLFASYLSRDDFSLHA